MFVLVRAVTWATLFIGLVLVALPARLVAPARGAALGPRQLAGFALAACGGALALWCIATFALVGRGTPAPFDPPRRLVVRGPYAWLRNPMYAGAALALAGAALSYASLALFVYAAAFLLATHAFVVLYEEPTLRRTFGAEYEAYCQRVARWRPRPPERGAT
jgi:protein-S-isoprenylcysteine O-methyltransferase Ste14